MSYVPIVVAAPQPPSPRTRELADQLSRVISDFEQSHPTVSRAEVRHATQLALRASRRGSDVAPGTALAVVSIVLIMVGLGVVLTQRGGGLAMAQSPLMGLAVVVALIGFVSMVVRRNL